jgi:pimeloyl-ACP methyl ester carboxylesterase
MYTRTWKRFLLGLTLILVAGPALARDAALVQVRSGGVPLVGALHLPDAKGPFSAVVLLHGSERAGRNHPGYLGMVAALNREGIAAVVFDKRGVGDSGGKYVEAPDLQISAQDAVAWVDFLRTRPEISSDRIGVLGWSQGGWVGPLAAALSPHIRFVVTLSGPGVSPLEQNIFDKTNRFQKTGASPEAVEQYRDTLRKVWSYVTYGTGGKEAQEAWDRAKKQDWFDHYTGPPMMQRELLLKHERMLHYEAHSSYEPEPTFRTLKVPMLAVFGEADTIVPVEASVEAMRRGFGERADELLTILRFPNADHTLRVPTVDGAEPAPGYPDKIIEWIVAIIRPQPPQATPAP